MPDVVETGAGFSTEIDLNSPTSFDNQQQQSGAPASKGFVDYVPEAYRGKDWVNQLSQSQDPMGEMFKQFDNQLSLIGRKAEGLRVPGEGAAPEDWQNFYKQIGVPDSPDKYDYEPPAVDESLKPYYATDEKLIGVMKEAAMKAGLRPEGFKALAQAFDNYYLGELQQTATKTQEYLNRLENDFKQKHGERSQQILETWQNSLNDVSQEQLAVIESLDPRVKVLLAEQFDKFAKKYVREDSLNLGVPSQTQAMNATQYGEEYARAFAALRRANPGSPEYLDAKKAYENLRAKGQQLFGA